MHRLLSSASRRKAIQSLLASRCTAVVLTAQGVTATWMTSTQSKVFARGSVLSGIRNVLALSNTAGPRESGPSARGAWLTPVLGTLAFLSPTYLLLLLVSWECDGRLPLWGGAAGLGVGLALRRPIAWLVAGDPGSFRRYRLTAVLAAFNLAMLGAAAPLHLNVALDASPPVDSLGKAASVAEYDGDSGTHWVHIDWDDGAREEDGIVPPIQKGDVVVKRQHRGAWGFAWAEHTRRFEAAR